MLLVVVVVFFGVFVLLLFVVVFCFYLYTALTDDLTTAISRRVFVSCIITGADLEEGVQGVRTPYPSNLRSVPFRMYSLKKNVLS